MKISFAPIRTAEGLTVATRGDIVVINDEEFDFSRLSEGDVLPAKAVSSDWFAGRIVRTNGELEMTLVLPHGSNAPKETLFPKSITINADGPVAIPAYEV